MGLLAYPLAGRTCTTLSEAIMQARGERARGGGDRRTSVPLGYDSDPATVAGSKEKTTEELAKEMGMSERTYQQRAQLVRNHASHCYIPATGLCNSIGTGRGKIQKMSHCYIPATGLCNRAFAGLL
jgi:hypothetical protein